MTRKAGLKRWLYVLICCLSGALAGCGSGGSGSGDTPATTKTFSNGASLSIVATGQGSYRIQADQLQNAAGFDVSLDYTPTEMSGPQLTQGSILPGAILAANTGTPGHLRFAMLSNTGFSGSGALVNIQFGSDSGRGTLSLESVTIIDPKGRLYQ